MNQPEKMRLGDVIFQGIDENDYLNELYKNILYNYAITVLQITNIKQLRGINVDDALRFADLLSKSTHAEKADSHKIWAHEIITMLLTLYPDDEVVHYYAGSVLTSTGNFMGRKLVQSQYVEPTAMDELFSTLSDLYLTVPAAPEKSSFSNSERFTSIWRMRVSAILLPLLWASHLSCVCLLKSRYWPEKRRIMR